MATGSARCSKVKKAKQMQTYFLSLSTLRSQVIEGKDSRWNKKLLLLLVLVFFFFFLCCFLLFHETLANTTQVSDRIWRLNAGVYGRRKKKIPSLLPHPPPHLTFLFLLLHLLLPLLCASCESLPKPDLCKRASRRKTKTKQKPSQLSERATQDE